MPILWILGALAVGAGIVAVTGGSSGAPKGPGRSRPTAFSVSVQRATLQSNDRTAPYDMHQFTTGDSLPDGSPEGFRWLVWQGNHITGRGLDANGQWWMRFMGAWIKVTPTDGGGFLDTVDRIVTTYVAPAIAITVGAVIPGIGGVAAAAMIKAWIVLANGGSVGDVLAQARDRIGSFVAAHAFDQALAFGRSALPLDKINAARAALVTENERTSFDQGLVFAAAEKAQRSALESLKASMPSKADLMEAAFSNGAAVEDLAYAFGGNRGLQFVQNVMRAPVPKG